MNVPMLDLKAQYAPIRDEIMQKIEGLMDSLAFCNGPAVRELEQSVAEYCSCAEAIGVSSGTDALLISMMALGIGAGDEVITTPFTFFATAGCISRTGAKPVFVDIEPDTFNIDTTRIEAAITDKTKAVLPVHLYGQMVDMDEIMDIAQRRGLFVIEDAAQSIGATYKGKDSCSIGTTGCLSFYPTKNLGAMGDAGMVLTNDSNLAERLRMFRLHGQGSTYIHQNIGGNFRMDSLCAVGLSVKLKRLNDWNDALNHHAARYNELLAGVAGLAVPTIREYNHSVYHQYVIRTSRRDDLSAFLTDNEIGCGVYYPLSLHQQECFAYLGYKEGDFPQSELATKEVLALPIFPELTDEQIDYVADKIKECLGG